MEVKKPLRLLTKSTGTWRDIGPGPRIFAEQKWGDIHLWGETVGWFFLKF